MINDYTKKYIKAIGRIAGVEVDFDNMDKEELEEANAISEWIDKIYQDGYEDGGNK